MADSHSGITSRPTGEYRGRLPSPPRMLMEGWPGAGLKGINLSHVPPHINVDAIRDFFDPQQMEGHMDWDYDQRRDFQRVLPFLSLGPFSAIKEASQVQSRNFTSIIAFVHVSTSTGTKPVPAAVRNASQVGIATKVFHTSNNQELIKLFPTVIEAINGHMERNPQGLIAMTCETGNDRSASALTAYIMAIFDIDAPTAIQVVTSKRFCCAIDDDRKSILEAWSDITKAQRDAGAAPVATNPNLLQPGGDAAKSRKRSRERQPEDEVDEMDTDDASQRRDFTPFHD